MHNSIPLKGRLLKQAYRFEYRAPHPEDPNRILTTQEIRDVLHGFVADRISGFGKAESRDQAKYVTLSGFYQSCLQARVTIFGDDNVAKVKEALTPFLDKDALANATDKNPNIPFTRDVEFSIVVKSSMQQFGFTAEGVTMIHPDSGERVIVIPVDKGLPEKKGMETPGTNDAEGQADVARMKF